MGFRNFDMIKNSKMQSNGRHLCLVILLVSVVVRIGCADDQSGSRSGDADQHNPPNFIQLHTKNNNRDLEISVRKPQTPHHHQHHHHHHHQQQQQQQHHFRHQSHNSEHRSRSSGAHHKQHNHQSNDTAHNRIPGYQRQSHSPKKHSNADNADGGGFRARKQQQQQQHQQKQQQQQHHRMTTIGPNRSRPYNRSSSRSWSAEITSKKNWSDNLSRSRQAPHENTHSSMNRNKIPNNPYMRTHHTARRTTTTTTTTTTTSTTAAPDFPEKVLFDVQSNFNNIESDENDDLDLDYEHDYDDNFDPKKRSPSNGSFDRDRNKSSQQSGESFQRDDPVRSSNYNGITTTTFKSQHSSNDDNYQLNMNNDGSTNRRRTIETSKSLVDDVKTNLMTRNIQTRNGIETGALTEEKFKTLGTPEAVRRTYNAHFHRPDPELVNQVSAHIRRVSNEGSCKPKLKVIPLEHHPSKTFNPHCTVLHRCSDDTGCCHADFSTCKPRRIQNVTLPFWVSTKGHQTIEFMTFENHTECQCMLRSSLLMNDDPEFRSDVTLRLLPLITTTTTTTIKPTTTTATEVTARCRCPNHFAQINGSPCKCDCPSNQTQANETCNKLKTGQEHFSINERRCIINELCERPICAFGEYNVKFGHCPREDEALTFSSNTLNSD